jgi:hypothetical protein
MPGYIKTVWQDGENKYDIKTQADAVINSDVKMVYKGTGGTPVSASNLQKIENQLERTDLLDSDIEGTTQVPTLTGSDITKIEHKETGNLSNIVRTDTFAYTRNGNIITKIVETRTLSAAFGSITKTLTYNFDATGKYVNTVVS